MKWGEFMKHLIIDKSEGDARVVCDEYGDAEVFGSYEAAEAYRTERCDLRRSYVFPKTSLVLWFKAQAQVWARMRRV